MIDREATAARKREYTKGDLVRAVSFVLDEGLRIWPDQDPTHTPAGLWRVVRVEGQAFTELMTGDQQACQTTYPEATYGINDNESVPPGTEGTVDHVDDAGSVWVRWHNGRRFAATVNDTIEKVT